MLVTLASCNVYDSSLLGGGGATGSGGGGQGNTGGTGTSGTDGEDGGADHGGTAGTQNVGGTGGTGGTGGSGVSGGTSGSDNDGGEPPGMGGEGGIGDGGASAGSGGGGTGGAGTGGTGGSTGGSGGSSGSGGSGGVPSATGCAKLLVPLDASGDRAHFVITLTSTEDFSSDGIISLRFYVYAGSGGSILPYVQEPSPNFVFFGRPLAELSNFEGWSVINWNVATQAPGGSSITKSNIKRVGVEITASPSTVWTNPTIVYLDSITVKGTTFPFDTAATVSTSPGSADQSGQVLWLNNSSGDTTAAGTTLSWQASCP